ncbi:hypothetical protein Clacol_000520 [Clathrus columnatus]|uniref:Uncharacterized protein n=1 Tax=Clathrus columnatus TaxID=1419009 RepID=A0AAV4ZWQ7_9AGAM|nr:hypothetical protein Clacol_000520 [Clathrus columnatus]
MTANVVRMRSTHKFLTSLPVVIRRTYVSEIPFVPPSSLDKIEPLSPTYLTQRPKPETPTFYTGRSEFYDALSSLENQLKQAQSSLRRAYLLPFPEKAKQHLPHIPSAWKGRGEMSQLLRVTLTTSRHRKAVAILNELNECRKIALAGGEDDIATDLRKQLSKFERNDAQRLLGMRKRISPDEYGRTYALGRRKESSARVWIIGTKELTLDSSSTPTPSSTTVFAGGISKPLQTTTILVNNLPLAGYFPNIIDRQRVVRPFKLSGTFGEFNVFALVRGGGTTGQAEAIAHGIAKNLVAHHPELELILKRGGSCFCLFVGSKVLKRDPRMVERKKTGLAKARKRPFVFWLTLGQYAWVKR